MAVTVQCPNPTCSRTSRVPEDRLGRPARCHHCGTRFTPAAATVDESALASAPGPSAPEPDLPRKVGRFEVRARLGSGAFGTVYRAYDPQLDREVALKVPRAGALDGPAALRFLREARAAARLHHPCVVPVFDAGQEDGGLYIASAFVEGRSLAAALDEGPLPAREAARLARGLAEALAYAHGQGVVHRDVKPANVLLDRRGEPHLTDFGLAFFEGGAERLTQAGAVVGTPAYMAPEQAAGRQGEVGPASDQYGLGVVLYEMLTGRTPFEGTSAAVLYGAVHREPPPPGSVNPRVPRDLETVCLRALAKRPEDRYGGCAELADDLRRWLDGEPVRARPLGPLERLARWGRRKPALAGALAAALGCLLLLAAVMTASAFGQRALLRREVEARAEAERVREEEQAARQRADASRATAARLRERIEGARKQTVSALAEAEQTNVRAKAARERAATNKKLAEEKLASAKEAADAARATLDLATRDRLAAEKVQSDTAARERGAVQAQRTQIEGRIAAAFRGTAYSVGGVAYSADGRLLAAVERGGWTIQVRDARTNTAATSVRHGGEVVSLALSADGRLLAWAGWDGTVSVWPVSAGPGEPTRALARPGPKVWGLAFSPDSKHLAAGGQDGTVRVWDVATGKEGLALLGHTRWVTAVAYSPDGKRLASASADKTVKVWDAETGKELLALTGHQGEVLAVAWGPDGRRLATAAGGLDEALKDRKGEVKVWDADTGREAFALPGHKSWATGVAFSPDGKLLASAGRDKTILLCRLSGAGRQGPLLTLTETAPVGGLAFRPDGKRLAWSTATFDREGKPHPAEAKTWDVAEARQLLPSAKLGAGTVVLSPDVRRVAVLSGGEARVLDTEADKQVASLGRAKEGLPAGPFSYAHAVFSRDGQRLALRTDDAGTVLWDLAGDTVRALGPVTRGNHTWAREEFSPDGKRFLGLTEQRMTLWDTATAKEVLAANRNDANQVAFSPDGRRLAALSPTGLKVWSADDGKSVCTAQLGTLPTQYHALAFTADSATVRALVELNSGGLVLRQWDAATGREGAHRVQGGRDGWLLVSPDGSYLVHSMTSTSPFSNRPPTTTLQARDLSSGKTVLRISPPPEGRQFFSPDGKLFLIQEPGGRVTVWDLPAGQKALTLTGRGSVWRPAEARPRGVVIYIPHGKTFGEIALWDVGNVHAPQALK